MRDILDHELSSKDSGHSLLEVQGMMELEFELAQREKSPLALMRIAVESLDRLSPFLDRQSAILRAIVDLVRALPRNGDLFAYRSGHEIVALLTHTPQEAVELMCKLSIESARKLAVPGESAPLHASLCIGLAFAQSEADLYFDTLLEVSKEGVAVASAGGGEGFIHTQLYSLYQRKLEKLRPRATPAAKGPVQSSTGPASPDGVAHAARRLSSADPPAAVNGHALDAGLEEQLRRAVAQETQKQPALVDLEQKVLTLARAWAHEALEKSLAVRDQEHEEVVDKLERRIAKLTLSHEQAEKEIQALANQKGVEPGVSSAYRYAQGLAREEDRYEQKLELLAKILEANLALQNRPSKTA